MRSSQKLSVRVRALKWVGALAILAMLDLSSSAQALDGVSAIQVVLHQHNAWAATPTTIRIQGRSTHNGITEPITITATQNEETAIEYENRRQIATPRAFFKDDGKTTAYQATPAGFTELDITGLFLLSELRFRPITASALEQALFLGKPAFRIHVRNDKRNERHFLQLEVADELDVFVDGSGLLAGYSRTFYKERPRFTSQLTYAFSDYRITRDVLLPYRIDKYVNRNKVESIEVTSYTLDATATPELFEPRRTK